jgi:hypothetical protein
MPRFVILEHDHPHLHWDLMLEAGAVLRTWRLAKPPEEGRATSATFLAGHRLAYLDYEGPVSGNRGRVVQWDVGEFDWVSDDDKAVVVVLRGRRARGRAVLTQADDDEWSFSLS